MPKRDPHERRPQARGQRRVTHAPQSPTERFDCYNLAARLYKYGDQLMAACEQGKAVESRVDVCNRSGAVCRIDDVEGLADGGARRRPEDGIAGSGCEGMPTSSRLRSERPALEAPLSPQAIPSLTMPPILPRSDP